jgi:glycosyltransferase involved in cell wall biosynthesis
MLFSILIATLEDRRDKFNALHSDLTRQIAALHLQQEVEILSHCDARQQSLSNKRNELIERAQGDFVAFVDDDDLVGPDYVERICGALRQDPTVDVVGIHIVITFQGQHPHDIFYSIRYREIHSRNHTYYRPPTHLNPVRREIARRYGYRDVGYAEDFEWALRVRDAGALRRETVIDSPIYYYRSARRWLYQWALDFTETFRHRFGLTRIARIQRTRMLASSQRSGN